MTTTVKVHVNGNYTRTVTIDNEDQGTVGPNETKDFPVESSDAVTIELGDEEVVNPEDTAGE